MAKHMFQDLPPGVALTRIRHVRSQIATTCLQGRVWRSKTKVTWIHRPRQSIGHLLQGTLKRCSVD
ncbi:hypothetical protein DPMN_095812 [Dreissena polymorpha]|uniref:Uncharacterized protein n=1 Tax=Dreissena polymorpha TaxID=45954 RepID=A0A9D4R4W1_DREPO|nr:hypothetical protein DPMN_095812 [Dreissena polymorpha]